MWKLKNFFKSITPEWVVRAYHYMRAFGAAVRYGFPARHMIIVGITGTKGKTSTANFTWSVLEAGGFKAGLLSSANFRIGEIEQPNTFHMTMPSAALIQKKLSEMHRAGVTAVAVEMTSEGMKQFRHFGIPVDIAVFTNLTPEHLASHKNDFEVYKKAKAPLFKALDHAQKTIGGKKIPRVIVANADSEHASYYLKFKADEKITYGITHGAVRAEHIASDADGTSFEIDGEKLQLSIPGVFNIYNALPAFAVGKILGISHDKIAAGLLALGVIPGRMERIMEGQDFTVIVDYAHEPASLGALLSAANTLKENDSKKVILLFGGQGGGRDPRKRDPMARVAAEKADYVIVANEDPYDDDPAMIVEEIAGLVESAGKKRGENLFPVLDRTDGILKALSLARSGDIVLIAGKGAEQSIMSAHGASIPWNERAMVRSILASYIRTRAIN